MKSLPLRLSVLILGFALCTEAQTYTYQLKLEANHKTGNPISTLAISGAKGYGSSNTPGLYQANLTGVRLRSNCCETNAALTVDANGNIYGQDVNIGNDSPYGRVFMISNSTGKEIDVYDFSGGEDGLMFQGNFFPTGAPILESPLTIDGSGNVWGVTYFGGGSSNCSFNGFRDGCGVVFELTNAGDHWTEQVIHAFTSSPDGAWPEGRLTFNPATGGFYGTTQFGGDPICNCGTVFQVSPDGDGTWSESIVYTFTTQGTPVGGVILDPQGNLYGTNFGNANISGEYGYIYEISQDRFSVLYGFQGFPDAQNPNGGLVMDASGNLLGTTNRGGTFSGDGNGLGTVFELSPLQNGWRETILHSFAFAGQRPTDGKYPNAGLAADGIGNFWGVAPIGGAGGYGVFFEVSK